MSSNSIKMLSVDDKTITTDLDRAGYRKMGVSVKPAANFEEARKILETDAIDLVVINMDYTKVNAVQICSFLKKDSKHKAIPVVLTSVQTSAKARNSAIDAGADLFVEQPLPRQYFIEKLKQLLAQKTRETSRVAVHGDVEFTFEGKSYSCPIGDLSSSGVLISTDMNLPSGANVDLSFPVDGYKKPVQVKGVVVRVLKTSDRTPDRKSGIGIRFQEFVGDSQKRLEKYIERSADQDARMIYYL